MTYSSRIIIIPRLSHACWHYSIKSNIPDNAESLGCPFSYFVCQLISVSIPNGALSGIGKALAQLLLRDLAPKRRTKIGRMVDGAPMQGTAALRTPPKPTTYTTPPSLAGRTTCGTQENKSMPEPDRGIPVSATSTTNQSVNSMNNSKRGETLDKNWRL